MSHDAISRCAILGAVSALWIGVIVACGNPHASDPPDDVAKALEHVQSKEFVDQLSKDVARDVAKELAKQQAPPSPALPSPGPPSPVVPAPAPGPPAAVVVHTVPATPVAAPRFSAVKVLAAFKAGILQPVRASLPAQSGNVGDGDGMKIFWALADRTFRSVLEALGAGDQVHRLAAVDGPDTYQRMYTAVTMAQQRVIDSASADCAAVSCPDLEYAQFVVGHSEVLLAIESTDLAPGGVEDPDPASGVPTATTILTTATSALAAIHRQTAWYRHQPEVPAVQALYRLLLEIARGPVEIACEPFVDLACAGPSTPLVLPPVRLGPSIGAVESATTDAPPVLPTGETEVVIHVVTAAGTEHACSTFVNVIDRARPTLTCPPDGPLPAGTTSPPPPVLLADDCDPAPRFEARPTALRSGRNRVHYRAVDSSGNGSDCTANLEVVAAAP